jgi:hypothetical protein
MPTKDSLFGLRVEEADLSTGDNELSLQAEANQSYQVMDVGLTGGGDDAIAEITIGEENMIAFPADDGDGELFREESILDQKRSLYGWMRDKGLPAPMLQVPEGDEFIITEDTDSATATVLYAEGDANFASPNQPGGPGTKRRVYPVTGQTTQSIAGNSTETVAVEDSLQPGPYDDFPFGVDVQSNREYDLLALALDLDSSSGANVSLDTFRLTSEEIRFLENDAQFVDADLAPYPNANLTDYPLVFEPTPTYTPGDELDLEVEATNSTSGAEDAVVTATFIFDRRAV